MAFNSRGLARSRNKPKPLYLHYHNVYIATKFARVVTYFKGLPLIKLHYLLILWFCEVTSQIKYFISSLALDQMAAKNGKVGLTVRDFHQ